MGELRFDPEVFTGVSKSDRERLLEKTQWLWDNRRVIDHHPLRHDLSGFFKKVVGKYRIIYSYDENPDQMIIYLVGTRDTIYKDALKRLR
jgi:mRNA-degrading endonuclease RelE of RelBE toxin-antitoxin system